MRTDQLSSFSLFCLQVQFFKNNQRFPCQFFRTQRQFDGHIHQSGFCFERFLYPNRAQFALFCFCAHRLFPVCIHHRRFQNIPRSFFQSCHVHNVNGLYLFGSGNPVCSVFRILRLCGQRRFLFPVVDRIQIQYFSACLPGVLINRELISLYQDIGCIVLTAQLIQTVLSVWQGTEVVRGFRRCFLVLRHPKPDPGLRIQLLCL